jgi:hypothetical protein
MQKGNTGASISGEVRDNRHKQKVIGKRTGEKEFREMVSLGEKPYFESVTQSKWRKGR